MSRDDFHTLLAALAPGGFGLAIGVAGLLLRLPQWRHRRIWFASLTFILLQTAVLVLVGLIFAGGFSLNPFTIVCGCGLIVDVTALTAYGFKAFRRSGPE
jgi:hypothetical protein